MRRPTRPRIGLMVSAAESRIDRHGADSVSGVRQGLAWALRYGIGGKRQLSGFRGAQASIIHIWYGTRFAVVAPQLIGLCCHLVLIILLLGVQGGLLA